MSEELFAISKISPAPAAQGDYDSICAALMQTQRGRWFLQEYAKRNRSSDTQILLAAIARLEAVVCAQRSKQAPQGFVSDLLDMAQAITRTRAEVAEIRPDGAAPGPSARAEGDASPPPPPRSRDIFAAAERIRDVTWAMRGHGFDPSTCDQLEELADSILSASALRDPTDRRARKLSEVLQYLEHRIESLIESSAETEPAAPEPAPARDHHALGRAPAAGVEHANGFAGPFIAAECERDAPAVEAHERDAGGAGATASPTDADRAPTPGTLGGGDRGSEVEDATSVRPPRPVVEIALEVPPDPELATAAAPTALQSPASALAAIAAEQRRREPDDPAAEPEISIRIHDVEWQSADIAAEFAHEVLDPHPFPHQQAAEGKGGGHTTVADWAAAEPLAPGRNGAEPAADTEPTAGAGPATAAITETGARAVTPAERAAIQALAAILAEPAVDLSAAQSSPSIDVVTTAAAPAQEALLPALALTDSSRCLPDSVDAGAGSSALLETAAVLPDFDMHPDMPGFDTAASGVPPADPAPEPAPPSIDLATDGDGERWAASGPVEPPNTAPEPPSPSAAAIAADAQAPHVEPAARVGSIAPLAAAPLPQPPCGDPLAALKAMSEDELIALFS